LAGFSHLKGRRTWNLWDESGNKDWMIQRFYDWLEWIKKNLKTLRRSTGLPLPSRSLTGGVDWVIMGQWRQLREYSEDASEVVEG